MKLQQPMKQLICLLLVCCIFAASCKQKTPAVSTVTSGTADGAVPAVLNFGTLSTQALRILALFMWEGAGGSKSLQLAEKAAEGLRKRGNVPTADAIKAFFPDKAKSTAINNNATLLFNFSLVLSGALYTTQAIHDIALRDTKTPLTYAPIDPRMRRLAQGVGMFFGGTLGLIVWAARNPKDPMSQRILKWTVGTTGRSVVFLKEVMGEVPDAKQTWTKKLRINAFKWDVAGKFADLVIGLNEIYEGAGMLCRAALSNSKYGTMAPTACFEALVTGTAETNNSSDWVMTLAVAVDDTFQGMSYVGNGVCRIWNRFIPGYAANLPGALFSTAIFIRQLDGGLKVPIVKDVMNWARAPLDNYMTEQAKLEDIRNDRDQIYHQWRFYWRKGHTQLEDKNLKSRIEKGFHMVLSGEDIQPFKHMYEVVQPLLSKSALTTSSDLTPVEMRQYKQKPYVQGTMAMLSMINPQWRTWLEKMNYDILQAKYGSSLRPGAGGF